MSTLHTISKVSPGALAAVFVGGGAPDEELRYDDLERRSRRLAVAFRGWGLEPGDTVALLAPNAPLYLEVYWAVMRAGLYFTPINWHLQAREVAYIATNSDAKVLIATAGFAEIAAGVAAASSAPERCLSVGGDIAGFEPLEEALAAIPAEAVLENPLEGSYMMYSSGTTGMPKGVRQPLSGKPAGDLSAAAPALGLARLFGLRAGDRYLSPAPLYHAAPLLFSTLQQRIGATAICMRRFDPSDALATIESRKVTTSQWVPTMFRRLLTLPDEERGRYDLSSQRLALHAAAPCPVPTKRAMIEWWGPIVTEYYAGTEGGGTIIRSDEWLAHPGSVGRHWTGDDIYVLDEAGERIEAAGEEGAIYFAAPEDLSKRFRYYKDDEKTESTYRGNLFTLGDVGYLDAEGYLFLTDRKSHMIISGGVNVYPQETENLLLGHPKVDDVAVIGVPNEDLGEEVKAVVIPRDAAAGPELEAELIAYCRAELAHYKCPKSIDFAEELPRLPTGKLLKRRIREAYWKDRDGRI